MSSVYTATDRTAGGGPFISLLCDELHCRNMEIEPHAECEHRWRETEDGNVAEGDEGIEIVCACPCHRES
jgi:hypothetical protein